MSRFHIKGKIIWDKDDPSAYCVKGMNITASSIDEAKETFKAQIQPLVVCGMLLTPKPNFPVEIYDESCYEIEDD